MKKSIIFTILCAGLLTLAQAQVQLAWYNYPGGVAIATDASDNVYTANWDYNPGGDITVVKRDASGNIFWQVPYNNTNNTRHEVATWVDTDNVGNVLVSGTIRSGYSNPVNANSLLMKFDPSGNLLWRVVYEADFDGSSTRKCLVDAQNNIYVLGLGNNGTGMRTKVKKFSPGGVAIWSYFDIAGIGAPVNFKFTHDNMIIITSRGITGSINGYAKIDLDGNLIWSYAGVNSLTVGDAAGDSFGNTYLVNGEYVPGNAGSIITKLSPSGTVIWSQTNTMKGNRVEVGTDNNPVISGYPSIGYGAAFMKYDNNGNILWQNLDADGPGFSLLSHAQLKLDEANAAYLAASTMSQMAVCKVNSDGTSSWTASTSSGYPTCLVFGTDNSVYVTGGTTARFIQSGSATAPVAPSNLSATASTSSAINLSWTDNSPDETSFVLQRSLSESNGFTTIATVAANVTSYLNSGLNSSTTYYYRIQAINSNGSSDWSNTANATTLPLSPPAAPGNLMATASGCTSINLTWFDNSNNETGFEVIRSMTLNGIYSTIAILQPNATSYNNTGLKRNKKYYYKIRAVNSAGNSAWSNTASAITSCQKALLTDEEFQEVKLFPNPSADGKFNLILPSETAFPVTLQIYSMASLKVMEVVLNDHSNSINAEELKNGIYILRLISGSEIQQMKFQVSK